MASSISWLVTYAACSFAEGWGGGGGGGHIWLEGFSGGMQFAIPSHSRLWQTEAITGHLHGLFLLLLCAMTELGLHYTTGAA